MQEYKFSNDEDFLGLEGFGKSLRSWIENSSTSRVFLIDAPWGCGKTVFSRQMQSLLSAPNEKPKQDTAPEREGNIVVRFDAFESDMSDDPFASVMAAIYSELKAHGEASLAQGVMDKAAKLASAIGNSLPGIAVRAGTKLFVGEEVEQFLAEAAGCATDAMFNTKVDQLAARQDLLKALHQEIQKVLHETKKKRLILIVDELDRCRPEYALDILDVLHHVLRADGVCTLIFAYADMLRSSVSVRVGSAAASHDYLEKFYDVHVDLPLGASIQPRLYGGVRYGGFIGKFIKGRLPEGYLKIAPNLTALSIKRQPNYREIEKVIEHLSLVCEDADATKTVTTLLVILIWVKYLHPDIAKNAAIGEIDLDAISEILRLADDGITHSDLRDIWNEGVDAHNKGKSPSHGKWHHPLPKALQRIWDEKIRPLQV